MRACLSPSGLATGREQHFGSFRGLSITGVTTHRVLLSEHPCQDNNNIYPACVRSLHTRTIVTSARLARGFPEHPCQNLVGTSTSPAYSFPEYSRQNRTVSRLGRCGHVDELSPVQKPCSCSFFFESLQARSVLLLPPEEDYVLTIGGDNATQREVSRSRNQLRRTKMRGRSNQMASHVNVVAACRILAKPGLATVLSALAAIQDARLGKLGRAKTRCCSSRKIRSGAL